jgi:hypothetical protein
LARRDSALRYAGNAILQDTLSLAIVDSVLKCVRNSPSMLFSFG